MSRPPLTVAYVLRAFPRLSETFILGEILALESRGMEVRIYALDEARERHRHPEALRLLPRVVWVPYGGGSLPPGGPFPEGRHESWAAGRWIGRHLAGSGVRHLHAHFAGPAATAAAAAAEVMGIPFSFTAHAKDIFVRGVDWAWVGELSRRASAVVTVCGFNRRYLRARLPAGARVVRIRNGVDLRVWRPSRAAAPSRRVVAVGRLVRKKGFHDLVEAMGLLGRWGVEAGAVIVGDGVERPRLESMVRSLGLRRRVRLTGPLPQPAVRRLVRRAAVVALPSVITPDGNSDALPTVLLEAGACAVPVVATRVAGIPEIVRHRETGLLVPPDRPHALARALRRLLASPALRRRLGRAARRRIERHFDRRVATAALERLFATERTSRPEVFAGHAYRAPLP